MQRRLAVVDAALGVDGDEDIFIEARGVADEFRPKGRRSRSAMAADPAKSSRGTAAKAASILGSLTPALRVTSAA